VGADRFIREPLVKEVTGLSRTTRWRLERSGKFPARRKLSENAVGWLETEILEWVATRKVLASANRPESLGSKNAAPSKRS
jgi:prophage regulatory protein